MVSKVSAVVSCTVTVIAGNINATTVGALVGNEAFLKGMNLGLLYAAAKLLALREHPSAPVPKFAE